MIERPRELVALYAEAQRKSTPYWHFSASRQQVRQKLGRPERPQAAAADRWSALQSVLFPTQAPVEPEADESPRPPMLAVLSAAGGVGKTCLVATLGRVLSGLGERVLLVETSACGLLPFYFASRETKPGVVRTFSSQQSGAPVRLLSLDGEAAAPGPVLDPLHRARGASRWLVDVGALHSCLAGRLLQLRPTVLVPLLADVSSLARLASLEARVEGCGDVYYLLNQFDASLPLHLDLRAMLERRLGGRLLPFVLRRSPTVGEALAEGMTVVDYAPASQVVEDYRELAAWLRSLAAPLSCRANGWTEHR